MVGAFIAISLPTAISASLSGVDITSHYKCFIKGVTNTSVESAHMVTCYCIFLIESVS